MKIGVIGSGYIGNYLREAIMLSNLNAEAIIIDNNNKDQFQDFVKPKEIPIKITSLHQNTYEIKSGQELRRERRKQKRKK